MAKKVQASNTFFFVILSSSLSLFFSPSTSFALRNEATREIEILQTMDVVEARMYPSPAAVAKAEEPDFYSANTLEGDYNVQTLSEYEHELDETTAKPKKQKQKARALPQEENTYRAEDYQRTNAINKDLVEAERSFPSKIRFSAAASTKGRQIYAVDYILPLYYSKDETTLLFLNPKQSWQSPLAREMNIGGGIRKSFQNQFILGLNFFYDKKYSRNKIWHDQFGYGAEYLSQPFDFRFNYYAPRHAGKPTVVEDGYSLGQTHLIYWNNLEEALTGYDFEFGFPVFPDITRTRVYLGGFVYNSKLAKDVNGFRFRTETDFNKWFALDTTFNRWGAGKTEFIGGVRLTVPLELGRIIEKKNPFESPERDYITDRLFERVVRDIDVQTTTTGRRDHEVADTEMIYVDSANTSGIEDGTLSHPYTTLAGALLDGRYVGNGGSARYVYIFPGAGEYDETATLYDTAVLWGAGYNGGYKGLAELAFPVVDGDGDNVVTLANDNTVMGLQIQHGNCGIFGGNISNATITHNIITENAYGIGLGNNGSASSGFNISNNTITSNEDGVYFENDNGLLLSGSIKNNTIQGNGNGIEFVNYAGGSGGTGFFDIRGNTITDNIGNGIMLSNSGGVAAFFDISNNTISCNHGGSGVYVNTSNGGWTYYANIIQNTLTDNGNGVSVANDASYTTDFNISANTVQENAGNGIAFSNNYGVISTYYRATNDLWGNTISGNGQNGILMDNQEGFVSNFDIAGNTISGNSNVGINIHNYSLNNDAATSNCGIRTNTITGNTVGGMLFSNDNGGGSFVAKDEHFSIMGNTLTGNTGDGIRFTNNAAGTLFYNFALQDNKISSNTGNGFSMDNQGNANTFALFHNRISGNGATGVAFLNSGTTSDFYFKGNTIAENSSDGVNLSNSGGTFSNMNFGDTTVADSGYNSIYGNTGVDFRNDSGVDDLMAENNWWGQSPPNPAQFGGGNTVDYDPWLNSNPN